MACYDWRTSPDVAVANGDIGGADLERAQGLVESAYNNSGGTPVYLGGHSNGPVYALALLHKMPADWVAKYIGEASSPAATALAQT